MKNKVVAVLLCFCMAGVTFGGQCQVSAQEYDVEEKGVYGYEDGERFTDQGIEYQYIASTQSLRTYSLTNCTKDIIEIPSYVAGYPVTEIKCYGFFPSSATAIRIPSTVTSVNSNFYGRNLKNIYVDSNNQKYTSINGVLFSKDGTVLCEYPYGRSDNSYEVPSGTKEIETWAFGCKNLEYVKIPSTVDYMFRAFTGADGLECKEVDSGNQVYKSIDGVVYSKSGDTLIRVPNNK